MMALEGVATGSINDLQLESLTCLGAHRSMYSAACCPVQELAGDDWWLDRKGEIPQGAKPFFRLPIFHYHKARH